MEKNPRVVIELTTGHKINIELYPEIAPISVENFLSLVDQNYYDNVIFHRIIANFMVQTGCYYINNNAIDTKPSVSTIKGEFTSNGVENNLKHTPGVISMARANDKNSASSQFFICVADCEWLDGEYAAFGKVMDEESMSIVYALSFAQTSNYPMNDFPVNPPVIKTIRRA